MCFLFMALRVFSGKVIRHKNDKTAVVAVEKTKRHPIYPKNIRLQKKYHAHDESNAYKVGDMVFIEESRPISKLKRWKVTGLVSQ